MLIYGGKSWHRVCCMNNKTAYMLSVCAIPDRRHNPVMMEHNKAVACSPASNALKNSGYSNPGERE